MPPRFLIPQGLTIFGVYLKFDGMLQVDLPDLAEHKNHSLHWHDHHQNFTGLTLMN